jgi:hypothetical protein
MNLPMPKLLHDGEGAEEQRGPEQKLGSRRRKRRHRAESRCRLRGLMRAVFL